MHEYEEDPHTRHLSETMLNQQQELAAAHLQQLMQRHEGETEFEPVTEPPRVISPYIGKTYIGGDNPDAGGWYDF